MIKIVFQGDSITDAARDRRNFRDLGKGYAARVADILRGEFPETEFDFINTAIAGDRISQVFDRIFPDAIDFEPDVISLFVGVNDVGKRELRIMTTDEQIEVNYRTMLQHIRNNSKAKIVVVSPYALDHPSREALRAGIGNAQKIIEKLAKEYADVYIPMHEYFAKALKNQPKPLYYSDDGVHPNQNGVEFIGKKYAEAVIPLIKELIK